MNKFLSIILLFFLFSCSNIEKRENLTNLQINNIQKEIVEKQELIKNMAKVNNLQGIKKNVVSTLKNNLIISKLSNFDLSKALIVFSDKIDIISSRKAKNIILINFELETIYLDIYWEYIGNEWKIKNVESHE